MARPALRLGLIGDCIHRSQSPRLHIAAGGQAGIAVNYDLLVPADLGRSFDEVFESARQDGYRGLNITYPYKERVLASVTPADPLVARLGAVNTVVFGPEGARGHNTDHTGYLAAHRAAFGQQRPGRCLLIGAGGVGRAIGFALGTLGAAGLVISDSDTAKAAALAAGLAAAFPDIPIDAQATPDDDFNGLLNCTPIGMDGQAGMPPVPDRAFRRARWAFDAVYTPTQTAFLSKAQDMGLRTVSGWELFFHQGLAAWEIFSARAADPDRLRRALKDP